MITVYCELHQNLIGSRTIAGRRAKNGSRIIPNVDTRATEDVIEVRNPPHGCVEMVQVFSTAAVFHAAANPPNGSLGIVQVGIYLFAQLNLRSLNII